MSTSVARVVSLLALFAAAVPVAGTGCSSDEKERSFGTTEDAGSGGSTGGGAGTGGSDTGGSDTGGSATGGSATGGSGGTAADASVEAGTECSADADCDDKEPCNGAETCSNGNCVEGTALSDGDPCERALGTSDGGVVDAALGDATVVDAGGDGGAYERVFICMAQVCSQQCDQDDECDDASVCTGSEICHPTDKVCMSGTPKDCSDGDDCTEDKCDSMLGCFNPLIDADGDGHADEALGACGDDCDDDDDTVFTGAQELCDSKDNNCDGQADEGAEPFWYADCDEDGFAAVGAVSVQQCDAPTAAPAACGGGGAWVSTAPGAGTTDCVDTDPKAHPYLEADNINAFSSTAIAGVAASIDFDFNCDGTEEKRFTATEVATDSTCSPLYCACKIGQVCYCPPSCVGLAGYSGATAPACGSSAYWTNCAFTKDGGCARVSSYKVQECR